MKAEGRGQRAEGKNAATEAGGIRMLLAGGDRRSIGRADEVAALALSGEASVAELCAALTDEDPVVQMRAADALEKVSARQPESLHPAKADFLALLAGFRRPEMRWHAAQMLPRLGLTAEERDALALPVLTGYLRDGSRIVQTCALQALAEFAAEDAALRPRVGALLAGAIRTGSSAAKARSRKLLARFAKRG